jgi:hypothetical protein
MPYSGRWLYVTLIGYNTNDKTNSNSNTNSSVYRHSISYILISI